MGKEEIAHHEQFLLFPQCFLLNQKTVFAFVNIFDIIFLIAGELEEAKIGICGKGLKGPIHQVIGRKDCVEMEHPFYCHQPGLNNFW